MSDRTAYDWIDDIERMQGGPNGPTIRLRACVLEMDTARKPLDEAQALELARKHLDQGLSWAPYITRCTDLEIRALIRAVEAAHGIDGA
jgi:hypothetical protein